MAELVVKVDPQLYRKKNSTESKGRVVLYMKIQKSLYGILKSSLLFYHNMVGDKTREIFKIHPHDPCVMKKIVGGGKMTVVFHVDALKVSHKINKAITTLIEYLDGIYSGLKAVCGDVHDYLGMIFY